MSNKSPQIIQIMHQYWYIETQTGLDGPYKSEEEANSHLNEESSEKQIPLAFAGLDFTDKAN